MSFNFNFNVNAGDFSFNPNASGFQPDTPAPTPEPVSTPEPKPVKEEPKPVKKEEPVKKEPTPVITNEHVYEDSESSGDAPDFKEHVNICFIGHVDAGKSTISGNILLQTGMVDDRTIEKYTREAKENNRDSWFLAFIVDTDQEERARGKTVEVGRAHFNTSKKRYTILDAPGHKDYVPNMISGVAQADVAILIISARSGEFEAGFEKSGQTREHTTLAKTLGIKKLIVIINKMDEETVQWSEERYNDIISGLKPFLKQTGYSKNVSFIPISGYTAANLVERVSPEICPWYNGPSLIEALDDLPPIPRKNSEPLRIPVLDKYRDRGHTVIIGKIESGTIRDNHTLCIAPGYGSFEISILENDDGPVNKLKGGENVQILVKSSQISEDEIQPGYVIYRKDQGPPVTDEVVAQIMTMKLDPRRPFSSGFDAVMHIHTAVTEVTVSACLELKNKAGKRQKVNPAFIPSGSIGIVSLKLSRPVPIEKYEDYSQLGRFTLRDEGRTIAFGQILATHAPKRRGQQ